MKWIHRNFWPLLLVGIGFFFVALLGWSLYQSVIHGSSPLEKVKPSSHK